MNLNLLDSEKRDIIKYLESGKPLPDKYRFLLFDTDREVELLWDGKTDEVENIVLPFQTIEHIDEPRSEEKITAQTTLFDTSGRQIKGWSNKLIWGDNKLILSSLKNGPLRKQIEAEGGLKLIYIDPPFDVGADFSMNIEIGEDTFTKKPSVIEEIAYRDTWGKGADSFIAMIYERLKLMHGLLADDGSIYVHCDWRLVSYMRLILDEIFGQNNFRNEIIWHYQQGTKPEKDFGRKHDTIFRYSKSENVIFNQIKLPTTDPDRYKYDDGDGRKYVLGGSGMKTKYYADEARPVDDVWTWLDQHDPNRILQVNPSGSERIDYPTQKSEKLLERIKLW
ncbi:MAG: site-specific DNA-methyltransferase [Endomicrobiaceae bacterium]|nr:site-specific DNA-methyltransferase [Endomicrobiaceae bacterium]